MARGEERGGTSTPTNARGMLDCRAMGSKFYFFWLYQALPGLTGLDRSKASPQSKGRYVVNWLVELIRLIDESLHAGFAERAVLARATGSHSDPLYTDKVSKCSRG